MVFSNERRFVNVTKVKSIVIISFLLLFGSYGFGQNTSKFFYSLDIDSCSNVIIKEIENNNDFALIRTKTERRGGGAKPVTILIHPNYLFELKSKKKTLKSSDSTFVSITDNNLSMIYVEGEFEKIYSQEVKITTYFSDSLNASKAFNSLQKKLSKIKYVSKDDIRSEVNNKPIYTGVVFDLEKGENSNISRKHLDLLYNYSRSNEEIYFIELVYEIETLSKVSCE